MKYELNELIEEHEFNLEALDELTPESFKNLYVSLLTSLIEIKNEN